MDNGKNRIFKWRAFTSVLTALSFIAMIFTGTILFVTPPGRFANWTDWTLIALTKHQWSGLHICFGLIFAIASAFHVYFNWKQLVNYFRNKVGRAFAWRADWALALVIFVVVFVGTLGDIAPFSTVLAWNESIKHGWETPSQRAPVPHAESLTLAGVANYIHDVNLADVVANLNAEGIEVALDSLDDVDVVFGELAEAYNMTPIQLFEIAVGDSGYARYDYQCTDAPGGGGAGVRQGGGRGGGAGGGQGGGRGGGFGRLTLKQYCDQMGLDTIASVEMLKKAGFEATPEMTIRAITETAGAHPSAFRTALEPQNQ